MNKTVKQLLNPSSRSFFFLSLLLIWIIPSAAMAQQQQSRGDLSNALGLSAANRHIPEEADYKTTGGNGEIDKFELFLDVGNFRFAANAVHGLHKREKPDKVLASNTVYIAYRYRDNNSRSNFEPYLMGGIALVSAYIKSGDDVTETSDDYGYVLGAGALYYFSERLGAGLQLLRISAEGDFDGDKIETGSDQIQLVFKVPFQ